jgi:hypothetical protein
MIFGFSRNCCQPWLLLGKKGTLEKKLLILKVEKAKRNCFSHVAQNPIGIKQIKGAANHHYTHQNSH